MAVRIRLRRMGAKKKPFYRIVVADSRSPRDGRFLDTLGTYDPLLDPAGIEIDEEKVLRWLEEGAEPTDSARSLLSRTGVWARFKGGTPPSPPKKRPIEVKLEPKPEELEESSEPVEEVAEEAVAEEPSEEVAAVAEESSAHVEEVAEEAVVEESAAPVEKVAEAATVEEAPESTEETAPDDDADEEE